MGSNPITSTRSVVPVVKPDPPGPSRLYLAFDDRPFRLQMALKPLDPRAWIEVDEHYASEMAEKERLLRERRGEVVAAVDDDRVADATDELLGVLVGHVLTQYPQWFVREAAGIRCVIDQRLVAVDDTARLAVDRAGRLVQEDLCLMIPMGERLVLGAASVCFPNRWRLLDKLGADLRAIHGPVPHYAAQLGAGVDRALAHLRGDRPVWRMNWALMDDPALYQPESPARREPGEPYTPADVLDRVSFRAERQTLRRLPGTGAVVFTIRTYRRSLRAVCADREVARRLAVAVGSLTPEMAEYKSVTPFRDALLAALG